MGQRVEFQSNSHTCQGWLATPPTGKGAAIVVVQEWWGLVEHIQDVVDRFAKEGFLAIAPDLYHGKMTKSPDEAQRLLMELDADRAQKEIAGAGAYLLSRPECSTKSYGVVGFCMGGAIAQYDATHDSKVAAAVSFYGGFRKLDMQWENLRGKLFLVYAGNDRNVRAEQGRELAEKLEAMGKDVTVEVYPDTEHAFFNDTRPKVYDETAAKDAWAKTLDFFRKNLA